MSGTIFMSSENSEELENKWNPLHCHLCHDQYQEPCILQCYHSFCARCLENKVEDGNLACPICGAMTIIKEDSAGPPSDALLKFLVESASGDKTPCANCDQVQAQMYFCSTCCQSLCVQCREETHHAKMFQSHEILLQTKHTRDIQKHCGVHNEPYILFSTEKKVMLCINCFRDMKVESRSHCVDLETAYKQGCQKLDDTMQSIRDLQNSVRDGILLLRALLEEIESNVEKEKGDIKELYNIMQEKISETKDALLAEIDRQYEERVELFKNQLVSLTTFLPTLHVHLVTCAAFSSSANKYEFLDFTYVLMKRLMSIIQVQHPLHPSQTSDIVTEYKAKFAKCLEPLLFPHRNGAPVTAPATIVTSVASTRYDISPSINSLAVNSSGSEPGSLLSMGNSRNIHNKKFKRKLMETKGFFSDHCQEFDTAHREFMQKVESIKQSVQELQRDITLRRSLTKEATINELKDAITQAEEGLDVHQVTVEGKQTGLEKHWEESLERLAGEQEVYQAQLQDVRRLKGEVAAVKVILQKLSSFMTSIASVTQRLAPKLSKATLAAEHDHSHAAILQKINNMQPDSVQRVDAISKAQEVRDFRSANRVNPLDEELIKTKGLLRAPSERKESTMKRLSAEIKDLKLETDIKENQNDDRSETEDDLDEIRNDSTNSEDGSADVQIDDSNDKPDIEGKEIGASDEIPNESCEEMVNTDDENISIEIRVNGNDNDIDEVLDSISVELQDINDTDDISVSHVSADVNSNDLSSVSCTQNLPDVMVHMTDDKKSITDDNKDNSNGYSEVIEVSKELNVEVTYSEASGSESDFNTSTDSTHSSEEGVKPGLVKDLVAIVDGRTKPTTGVLADSPDMKASGNNSSPKVSESEINGTFEESVSTENIEKDEIAANEITNLSEENSKVPKVVDGVVRSPDSTSAEDEEVYVTKSLPELAQVFEPGELKRKRKRSKSAKSKDQ